jgi:signal transduction histidine kinase
LAGEIHDTVAQNLTGIILNLEAIADSISSGKTREHVETALVTARRSLAEARSLVWALKPPDLNETQLPGALERTLRVWSDTSGIKPVFAVEGKVFRLTTPVQITLLRVLQEACANVVKHAGATSMKVLLRYTRNQITMMIADDGNGFRAKFAEKQGYGLSTMKQRVRDQNGALDIQSDIGRGTALWIRIPVTEEIESGG